MNPALAAAILAVILTASSGASLLDSLRIFPKPPTKKGCALTPKAREFEAEPYYTGPLLDAHLHLPTTSSIVSAVSTRLGLPTPAWDKDLSVDYLSCLFEAEGITRAYGFHLFTKYSTGGEIRMAKKMEKAHPGKIIHFLMPPLVNPWVNADIKTIQDALAKNPNLFQGIGELKMYDGKSPEDPYLMALYDLAKEHDLVVMMHPFDYHKEAVERVLARYPTVKFLLHGMHESGDNPTPTRENFQWVMRIIERYENAYYSVDGLLPFYGFRKEHEGKAVPKTEILPHIRKQFLKRLAAEIARWKQPIEAYPDKFLFGTDRWHRPHFDREVSGLIAEFSRSFIGQLDTSVQEKFAYQNAERLLSKQEFGKEAMRYTLKSDLPAALQSQAEPRKVLTPPPPPSLVPAVPRAPTPALPPRRPVLRNIGFNLGTYDPATGRAGDILFLNKIGDHYSNKIFLEFAHTVQGPSGRKILPHLTYFLPLGTKLISPVRGVVDNVRRQNESNDYEIVIIPDGLQNWRISFDHIVNLTIGTSSEVKPGDVLGEVAGSRGATVPPELGWAELQLWESAGSLPSASCPFLFLDSSVRNDIGSKIIKLAEDWNAFISKNVYDRTQWTAPGCLAENAPG